MAGFNCHKCQVKQSCHSCLPSICRSFRESRHVSCTRVCEARPDSNLCQLLMKGSSEEVSLVNSVLTHEFSQSIDPISRLQLFQMPSQAIMSQLPSFHLQVIP